MHRIILHLIDISIMYSIANQMLSFFAPLKVSESLCLFCLKIPVTVTSKEMIFLSNCPIRNSAFVFQAD